MATVLDRPETAEQKVILHNVSWRTYERLLAEHEESNSTRFSYDQGTLEIMILSLRHERLKHNLATLVELLAADLNIDVEGAGAPTFRRQDLARGFEPDACFYIKHAQLIRTKEAIDLATDPAPELVIEIDISRPSLDKFPIFSGLGVPEVWRYDGGELMIFRLESEDYIQRPESMSLPGITRERLSQLLEDSQTMTRTAWLRRVREGSHGS